MSRSFIFASALLIAALTVSSAQAGSAPERVEKALQERIAAGRYQAAVMGVVDGEKCEISTFGKLDDGRPPDADTVFEIGSVTKTFTATLLAEAVLEGRVQLDEPVARLLPDFNIPDHNGKAITLLDLADQHSGLPRMPSNFAPADPANPYADYGPAKLKVFLAGYQLPRDPGSSYEYSNLGFGLLGFALAASAHQTYAALVEQGVLQPLGMTESGVSMTQAMRAHLAPGHKETGKSSKNWDLDALAGAGAVRSTVRDMCRYLQANMGVVQTPLNAAMKAAQQPRTDVSMRTRIGLAWMTLTTPRGSVVWHNGMTGGYASFVGFTPDGRRGVVLLANTAAGLDDLGFATLLEGWPVAPAYKAIVLSNVTLDAYAGSYQLAPGLIIKILRGDNQLYAQATGQGAFPIYPSATDEFFATLANVQISFTHDAAGAVNGLVLHQNGDRVARRLTAAELPNDPRTISLDAATLGDYVGTYRFELGADLVVTLKDGDLSARLGGQDAFPIYPSARDHFFYKVVDAQLTFERDPGGKVVAVILHQNGRDRRASRKAG
jgi:CubicO group peptidase (beta-lactamase class C family)